MLVCWPPPGCLALGLLLRALLRGLAARFSFSSPTPRCSPISAGECGPSCSRAVVLTSIASEHLGKGDSTSTHTGPGAAFWGRLRGKPCNPGPSLMRMPLPASAFCFRLLKLPDTLYLA